MKKAIQQIRLLIAEILIDFAMDVAPNSEHGKRLKAMVIDYFRGFDKDDLPF